MTTKPIHQLSIDVVTQDARRLVAQLKRKKTTLGAGIIGAYHSCPSHTQVWIDTTMTESELDDWLYRVKHGCEYVGVFERK